MRDSPSTTWAAPSSRGRRTLLAGLVTAYVATLIPWALSEPVRDATSGAFLALSAILAGPIALDRVHSKRLYEALSADDGGFASGVEALLALINQRGIAVSALQALLDAEQPALAPLPRKIARAWFLGIVGSAGNARCLAFESALNARVVADVLKPPTYAYGAYGSWARKPVEGART